MQVPNFCFINAANTTKYLFEKWKKWFFSNTKSSKSKKNIGESCNKIFTMMTDANNTIIYFPQLYLRLTICIVFSFFLHWTIIVFVRIICKELDGIINRTSTKFHENIHKTQGAVMLLVSTCIGNLDLIPPASFEPDPIPLLYVPDIPIPS